MRVIFQSLVVFTFLVGFLSQTEGRKCYSCSYWGKGSANENETCTQNPPPMTFLQTCGEMQCVTEMAKDEAGKTVVHRGCSTTDNVSDGCTKHQVSDGPLGSTPYDGERCVCSTDGCNSGTRQGPTTFHILIVAVMLISKM